VAVEGAHDCTYFDLTSRPRESVSAALALLGVNKPRVARLGQNLIEELFRNRIVLGDGCDLGKLVGLGGEIAAAAEARDLLALCRC